MGVSHFSFGLGIRSCIKRNVLGSCFIGEFSAGGNKVVKDERALADDHEDEEEKGSPKPLLM